LLCAYNRVASSNLEACTKGTWKVEKKRLNGTPDADLLGLLLQELLDSQPLYIPIKRLFESFSFRPDCDIISPTSSFVDAVDERAATFKKQVQLHKGQMVH
jgi:hypothetical protein